MTHPSLNAQDLLSQVTNDLKNYIDQKSWATPPLLVGIRTGGAWIAQTLHQSLQLTESLGFIDISFYRDDFAHKGLNPKVTQASDLPEIENRHIILVDDVIMSGRTIRAAFNELFDYGRPQSISLVTLISIPSRELPIQPDICGQTVQLEQHQRVKLRGPSPLSFQIENTSH